MMDVILRIIFWLSAFMIFWANVGYPISIIILGELINRKNRKRNDYEPTVTVMVVAHNEEKVIKKKLKNVSELDYPKSKLEVVVASDNSTDDTNAIVESYIKQHNKTKMRLFKVQKRMGKTNAQNEAAKTIKSEIIVMTDANAMLDRNAVRELVSSFDKNVAYVTGRLVYDNGDKSLTSNTENTYWDLDTKIRDIESRIQTITAGNGAIYACRRDEYHDFNPINCHDASMPLYYALNGKRAIANHQAIAYEKAGENNADEFKRKVRMSRTILPSILPSIKILNVFKYKWFTFFYLGHRTSRYLLWFNHIVLFIVSILLSLSSIFYLVMLVLQSLFYLIAIFQLLFRTKNKICIFVFYYCMTVVAQFVGVVKTVLRKNKPFWEKAESTR